MSKQKSDLACLLQQIDLENQAAQRALTGLSSGVARHAFIEARMERAAGHILQLLADGKQEEAEALMATRTLGDSGLEGLVEEEQRSCHTTTIL